MRAEENNLICDIDKLRNWAENIKTDYKNVITDFIIRPGEIEINEIRDIKNQVVVLLDTYTFKEKKVFKIDEIETNFMSGDFIFANQKLVDRMNKLENNKDIDSFNPKTVEEIDNNDIVDTTTLIQEMENHIEKMPEDSHRLKYFSICIIKETEDKYYCKYRYGKLTLSSDRTFRDDIQNKKEQIKGQIVGLYYISNRDTQEKLLNYIKSSRKYSNSSYLKEEQIKYLYLIIQEEKNEADICLH